MRLSGQVVLAAPPDLVRAVLADPRQLAEALPHVDSFGADVAEDGTFTVTIRPALALGEVPIRTTWAPLPPRPDGVAYRVEGRTDEHLLALTTAVRLTAVDGGAATSADWSIELGSTGTVRSAGQRVLGAIVAAQARLVLVAVEGLATAGMRDPA